METQKQLMGRREITANKITYKKIPNTIEAEGEVRIEDE